MNLAPAPAGRDDLPPRLALLVTQGLMLGLVLALLLIVANALFLSTFPAAALAYVYITVALLGSAIVYGAGELQKRQTLPRVAAIFLASTLLFLLLIWFGLTVGGQRWLAFPLIVLFPLLIQVGFVFLGGQAGRLLDVRQIRRYFPWIVTGFVAGFIVGGLLVPVVVRLLGRTEHVLPVLALFVLGQLALVVITGRRFPSAFELAPIAGSVSGRPARPRSIAQLLRLRYVLLIFGYEFLAAMIAQLTDFVLLAQTAARFGNSAAIAEFFSQFTVVLNGADLLFMLLVAGLFLRRFGLQAGLLANPLVMTVLVAAIGLAGQTAGTGGLLFFGLVVTTRIVNVVLKDGATRTAVNATYQAVPAQERALVQSAAEGIGAPLALGLVGLILLLIDAAGLLSVLPVVWFTLLLAGIWVVIGRLVYKDYAGALRRTIRRRALDPASVSLDDPASLAVVKRFLAGQDLLEVRLALDLLTAAEHALMRPALLQLAEHGAPALQVEALVRIEAQRLAEARGLVSRLATEAGAVTVRSAAIRALAALAEDAAIDTLQACLHESEPAVRQAALVGLLRYGGLAGALAGGGHLTGLASSQASGDRQLAARVLAEVGVTTYYQPLLPLLNDPDQDVRQAALAAAGRLGHPRLLPAILTHIAPGSLRPSAVAALTGFGPALVPWLRRGLAGELAYPPATLIALVRAGGRVQDEGMVETLKSHLNQPDALLRHEILRALLNQGYQALPVDVPAWREALRREVDAAADLAVALADLAGTAAIDMLQRALEEAFAQVRQRVFLILALRFETRAILRADEDLRQSDSVRRALAMEMLDVTLDSADKGLVLAVVDPETSVADRAERLTRHFAYPRLGRAERLARLASEPPGGSVWIQAAALYALGELRLAGLTETVTAALAAPQPLLRETAAWSLHRLDPAGFAAHVEALLADPSPRVRQLGRYLQTRNDG